MRYRSQKRTGITVHRTAFQDLVNSVLLQPSHEENAFFAKRPEPGIADEAFAEDHYGAFGQFQGFCHTAFMGLGVGDGGEARLSCCFLVRLQAYMR